MPIREVASGAGLKSKEPAVDVIAIHGLNPWNNEDHAFDTWRKPKGKQGNVWLRDQLPDALPSARIFIYEYESSPAFGSDKDRFVHQANDLLENVRIERRKNPTRPLVFVGHSLGGILIKQALVNAHNNPRYTDIREATSGLMFFSTPHAGGKEPLVALGKICARVVTAISTNPSNDIMQALQKGSLFSDILQENWRHQLNSYKIVSFYEGIGDIVPRESAIIGLPGDVENQVKLDANHSDMCRFDPKIQKDRDNLRLVQANLEELYDFAMERERKRQVVRNEKDQKIVEWICPDPLLNFCAKQDDTFRRHQAGTGQWLLDAKEFREWENGTKRTIWCHGIPGAGKTVLTSIVINHLEKTFEPEDVAIAYIYFKYDERKIQTVDNLIASLLQQLVQRKPVISGEIKSLYKYHKNKRTRPSAIKWSELLQSEASRFFKVFIIVDALDECLDSIRGSFLNEIRKLDSSIHILVTSRPIADIKYEFQGAVLVEILANPDDVKIYLKDRIKRERHLVRKVREDPILQEAVTDTIVENAKGMFLLAQLHMDSICKQDNVKAIRKALLNLPQKLHGIYSEAMNRIRAQDPGKVERASQVLSWICHALRPLTAIEIRHALAIEPGDVRFDEEAIPDEDILISICAGLVTIEQESNIIRLVHYTTQQYFEQERTVLFPSAQKSIATTCLTYLSFDVFAEGCCHSSGDMKIRLREFPLLEYAARHWGDHARGRTEEDIKELIITFLEHSTKLMCSSQVMRFSMDQYSIEYTRSFPKNITGLQIAASFGLKGTVRLLLETRADINMRDNFGQTALFTAAKNGHESVVELLLWAKADVNVKDCFRGWTALYAAVWNKHEAVVKLLLDAEADVSIKDDYDGRAVLYIAAENRCEAVVELLLEAKADINIVEDGSGQTILHRPAKDGDWAWVRWLLEHKADVNAADNTGRTALHLAAANGHEGMVRLLLDHNADVNAYNLNAWTALTLAVENGHEAVVRLLQGVKAKPSFNLPARQIWIARSGISMDILAGRIGGNSELTKPGHQYGRALYEFIIHERGKWIVDQQNGMASSPFFPILGSTSPTYSSQGLNLKDKKYHVWTSTLKAVQQTTEDFNLDDSYDVKAWKILDEINAGDLEGLTYEQFMIKYPNEFAKYRGDELRYRYPGAGGESYFDVLKRVRGIMLEIERTTEHVIFIGGPSATRVLLTYLRNLCHDNVADIDVPLGMLYKLEPKHGSVEFKAYRYNEALSWFELDQNYNLSRVWKATSS